MYIRKKQKIFRGMPIKKKYDLQEDLESIRFAGYLLMLQRQGDIEVYTHIPNETYTTSWNQKKKNRQKGVRAGALDYIIAIKGFIVFLEMKRIKGGVVSIEQKKWLQATDNKITISTVSNGYEEAKKYIDAILTRSDR
jgi:hypothetical protein